MLRQLSNHIALLSLLTFLSIPCAAWAQESDLGGDNEIVVEGDEDLELDNDEVVVEADEEGGRKTFSLGIRLGAWLAQLDAEAIVPRGAIPGTPIDIDGDLAIDETVAVPSFEFFLTTRFFQVYIDYFRFQQEQSTTLDLSVTFAGFTFNVNAPVETTIDLTSLGARFQVTPLALDFIELGITFGARYYRAYGEIRQEILNIEADDEIEVPVAFVGISARVFVSIIEIFGFIQGLELDYEFDSETEYDVSYLEYQIGAAVNIGDHIAVMVSYRGISLDLVEQKKDADTGTPIPDRRTEYKVQLTGPMISLRLRF